MLFELPELDIPSAQKLVEEARTGIPGLDPRWTDHNPSDPGLTLLELLAWLTEMVLYRAGRLRNGHLEAFLALLGGARTQRSLDEDLRQKVLELREPSLAVTERDFELLALKHVPGLRRVHCLGESNLEGTAPGAPAPGHVSLILLPAPEAGAQPPAANEELLGAVRMQLEPRRLLTTRLHVVGWKKLSFTLHATLHVAPDIRRDKVEKVKEEATKVLPAWLHPLTGGQDGQGWPFGRGIHGSEIYALLERVPGVDFVTDVRFVLSPGMEGLAKVDPKEQDDRGPPVLTLLHPAVLPNLVAQEIVLKTQEGEHGG